jgi:hypothetical protein
MTGTITVQLSDAECEVLAEISEVLDIPQDKLMRHALRVMQKNLLLCEDTNAVLRSAYEITKREGQNTSWEAFEKQLGDVLQRQHEIMYPKRYEEPLQ